ncbi:hypothetical protein NE237_009989 [Protea cynaroides]|uniref:Uncharacterized protein n=1 Tax=Protea cynaroides TaxID=273540 RepID=A0A9Q0KZL7_9MAGN|nr:hypothetical protein NE237_009989 [Protea cynaroides]
MTIQFQGRERMPELHQSHLSSSSPTWNYAYPYVISSPSDAADGPRADSESGKDHIPIAQPWPESKPMNKPSPPSSEEEEREDDDIDAQLKSVLESFRDLYRESEDLFNKVFSKVQQELLLKKQKKEGQVDPRRKAYIELGKKTISRILKQAAKQKQTKVGMFQRSSSLDSPRSPHGRFKIKPLNLGGGGGAGPHDIKGSTKDR